MAELYLRQGYRDEALGVYRKLVSQSPGDGALRSRMERLERELANDAGSSEPSSEYAADAMEADGDVVIAGLPSAIEPALVAERPSMSSRPSSASQSRTSFSWSLRSTRAGETEAMGNYRRFARAMASSTVLASAIRRRTRSSPATRP